MTAREYPSKSSPGTVYEARLNDNGLLSCNCRGWTSKRPNQPRHCAHTKGLAAELGLSLEERDGQMFAVETSVQRGVVDGAPTTITRTAPATAPSAFVEPMLASKMPDGWDADRYSAAEWVMEEKFDGHRLMVRIGGERVRAWSRLSNERTLPSHILGVVRWMPDGLYDGELVVPGDKSYGVVAGQNSGREVLVLFDVVEVLGHSVAGETQDRRREYLTVAYDAIKGSGAAVRLAEQEAPSMSRVREIWARGGEGAMLKSRAGRYRPGYRSADWIKVKAVASATLTITGFEAGKSGPYSAIVVTDGAVETTVKTLDNRTHRMIAADPESFVGRRLVISYQERTPSGKYRHPMFDHFAGEGE